MKEVRFQKLVFDDVILPTDSVGAELIARHWSPLRSTSGESRKELLLRNHSDEVEWAEFLEKNKVKPIYV